MSNKKIAVIVGSLRKNSYNKKLAKALMELAPSTLNFTHIEIGDLPLYNQDDDDNPAETVQKFKDSILASDALIILTPEYNRSIPGVLKNALDHGSRPNGKSVWSGRPAGILGVSPGAMGTAMAQQHLRNILSYLDAPTMTQPEAYIQYKDELFDQNGHLTDLKKKHLQKWMDNFVIWIGRFKE